MSELKDWVPLILGVLAWVPGLWGQWTAARKGKAESGDLVSAALERLYKPLLAQNDKLTEENRALKVKVEALQQELAGLRHLTAVLLDGARRLVHQIRSLGGEPVFDAAGIVLDGLGADNE